MQRWFYANEELSCEKMVTEQPEQLDNPPEPLTQKQETSWRFCVTVRDRELMPNEVVAVTGDCEELGNWESDLCVPMALVHEDNPAVWHVSVNILLNKDIAYRYLIVASDTDGDQMIVRFFESHLKPRTVAAHSESQDSDNSCTDIFGSIGESVKVERGWLTSERVIQFMFFKAPFKWNVKGLSERTFNVKVTPFFRKDLEECRESASQGEPLEELNLESTEDVPSENVEVGNTKKVKGKRLLSLCPNTLRSFTKLNLTDDEDQESMQSTEDTEDNQNLLTMEVPREDSKLSTTFAFNEVVNYNTNGSVLVRQPPFGVPCSKEDLVTVHLTIGNYAKTAYLIELFTYSKNADKDESPYCVGYRYVLPEDFKIFTHGYVETPIICASTHRLLGSLKFRFLIIHPYPMLKFDLSVSYLRHWTEKHGSMDVGHRGQGRTFFTPDNHMVYENTLYSFQQAIASGATMVEFDIHLTADLIPVVYHDFNVHISKSDPELLQNTDGLDVPVSKFRYEELLNLKLPNTDGEAPEARITDAKDEQKLFPTLSEVLENMEEHVAFDIEVKWPQQFCDRKWEEDVRPSVDRNIYVDRIIDVVMTKAGRRRIVFTSFDADICTLLRFKQNRYPVMILLRNFDNMRYHDPRTWTSATADNFAHAMELLGVVPHASTLIRCPSFIERSHFYDLTVFSYGVETYGDIALLKKFGVSAVIFDRMDKFAECKKRILDGLGGGDGCS